LYIIKKISESTKKVVNVLANESNKHKENGSITESNSDLAIESENKPKNKSKSSKIKKKK